MALRSGDRVLPGWPGGARQSASELLSSAQGWTPGRVSRFRAKGRSHEAVIFQRPRIPDNRHVDLDRRLGPVRTKESLRKLTRLLATDPHARVMRSTVQRVNGGWVISFIVQRSPKRRRARRSDAVVGVDLGLARLATLSTGHVVDNGRPLPPALRTLRRLQRQLDRQRRANNPGNYHPDGRAKKGCSTWVKSARMTPTEQRIAKLHERWQAFAVTRPISSRPR